MSDGVSWLERVHGIFGCVGDRWSPTKMLIGVDELTSDEWFFASFMPLGASSLPLEPRLSVLPSVGVWEPLSTFSLRGCSPGSSSLSFPFACA